MSKQFSFRPIDDDEAQDWHRVFPPPANARAGWAIDIPAVIEACNKLNVKLPIHFRWITGKYRHGTHWMRNYDEGWGHRITLHQGHSIERANETLWHELMHARQMERYIERHNGDIPAAIKDFNNHYQIEGAGGTRAYFESNAFEIEANQCAEMNKGTYLLKIA